MANVSTRANPAADIKAESGASVKRIVQQISLDALPSAVFYGSQQGRDVMPIEEMTNTDLAAAHRELMAKAWVARAANDIDTAQKYLRFIMPMTAEMARRMRAM
jgi:hypothetical protein